MACKSTTQKKVSAKGAEKGHTRGGLRGIAARLRAPLHKAAARLACVLAAWPAAGLTVRLLQGNPVFHCAHVVTQVNLPGGLHS